MPTIHVSGMSCNHCQQSVHEAISKIPGVGAVEVNLEAGTATWQDEDMNVPVSPDAVKAAVNAIGFAAS